MGLEQANPRSLYLGGWAGPGDRPWLSDTPTENSQVQMNEDMFSTSSHFIPFVYVDNETGQTTNNHKPKPSKTIQAPMETEFLWRGWVLSCVCQGHLTAYQLTFKVSSVLLKQSDSFIRDRF